jgi:hypothetical protein
MSRDVGRVERSGCTLLLPVPLIQQVRQLAAETRTTRSAIAALALHHYLRFHAGYLPSDAGPFESVIEKTGNTCQHK